MTVAGRLSRPGDLKVLDEAPGSVPLLLKAALPAIPGVSALPGLRKSSSAELPEIGFARKDVPIDAGHVASYAAVTAFPRKDTLPLPYLHMLAFPLHMMVLTDHSFPFPAMGTVHLENTITQHRAVTADERYDVEVWPQNLRSHPKGRAFDLMTEISVAGEVVWEEVSTYFRRGGGDAGAEPGKDFPVVTDGGVDWRLGGDLGRRYAAVSGDRNPIHLYAATAKAFGFPRQIAHGMWTKARCIAAIENRLPEAVRVEVAFKKPVLLPTTVRFAKETTETGVAFSLSDPKRDAPHLTGRATPA
jgi:hypothetical protein